MLFSRTIHILHFSKNTITLAKVRVERNPSIKSSVDIQWNDKTLIEVLGKLKQQYKLKKVRILLSEELSYVLRLDIPKKEKDTRQFIFEKIKGDIPEKLEGWEWDWKRVEGDGGKEEENTSDESSSNQEIDKKYKDANKDKEAEKEESDTYTVQVFSPVKSFLVNLQKAVSKNKIEIEAIESESISKTRNENPILGLALKKDIKGKDEKVLNVEVNRKLEVTDQTKKEKSNKKRFSWLSHPLSKRLIFISGIFIVIFILVSIVGYWMFLQEGKSTQDSFVQPTTPQQVTQEIDQATPTPLPSPTPQPIELSTYSIQILNGTGVAGEASFVQEILEAEGFEQFTLSNAEEFTYTDTEVQLYAETPQEVFKTIERALNSEYTVVASDQALEESEYDVVIIVGERL